MFNLTPLIKLVLEINLLHNESQDKSIELKRKLVFELNETFLIIQLFLEARPMKLKTTSLKESLRRKEIRFSLILHIVNNK
jgi:hypothetical protein